MTIDRYDPGFIKFRNETVAPYNRHWRWLERDLNNYRRYLEAIKYLY
jgi:hypothetical protein